eukprot:gene37788-38897_t
MLRGGRWQPSIRAAWDVINLCANPLLGEVAVREAHARGIRNVFAQP